MRARPLPLSQLLLPSPVATTVSGLFCGIVSEIFDACVSGVSHSLASVSAPRDHIQLPSSVRSCSHLQEKCED